MGDSTEWVLTHVSLDEFMKEEAWADMCQSVQDPYPAPLHNNRWDREHAFLRYRIIIFRMFQDTLISAQCLCFGAARYIFSIWCSRYQWFFPLKHEWYRSRLLDPSTYWFIFCTKLQCMNNSLNIWRSFIYATAHRTKYIFLQSNKTYNIKQNF